MRHCKNSRSGFLYLLALVLCVIALPRPSKAQASNYLITDLNPLSGGSQSKAFSINRAGRVVGQSNSGAAPSTQTPVSWDGTPPTNIGIFGGTGSGSAYAV
jgi:uncharacterized membrane protein